MQGDAKRVTGKQEESKPKEEPKPRLCLRGKTPENAGRNHLGVYVQQEELVKGKVAYIKEDQSVKSGSDEEKMMWFTGSKWFVGLRSDLGQNRGFMNMESSADTPILSNVKWELSIGSKGWTECPDIETVEATDDDKNDEEESENQSWMRNAPAYGLRAPLFGLQTDHSEISTPEVNVTRAAIADYFESQETSAKYSLFEWEKDTWTMEPRAADLRFLRSVTNLYYLQLGEFAARQIAGEDTFLVKTFEEYRAFRDIVFWFKYVQCTDEELPPEPRSDPYKWEDAELKWELKAEKHGGAQKAGSHYANHSKKALFKVTCKLDGDKFLTRRRKQTAMQTYAPEPRASNLRWGADASANSLGVEVPPGSSGITTEDDVLHVWTLPAFDNTISQADSEQMISILTTPYLRIPLLLQFFSTQSRMHALGCESLRRILQAAVLEPWRSIPTHLRQSSPASVPAPDAEAHLIGTSYGLLLNEAAKAPQLAPAYALRLLDEVLKLGSTNYHSRTTTIITFVLRLAVRVESALAFLLQLATGQHPSYHESELSGIGFTASSRVEMEKRFEQLQAKLRVEVRPLLRGWLAQLVAEEREAFISSPNKVDELCQKMAEVHAHLVLSVRNVPRRAYRKDGSQLKMDDVRVLLTSSMFLQRRHTFNTKKGMAIPETELFDMLQHKRDDIVQYFRASETEAPTDVHQLLQEVFQVGTGDTEHVTAWAAINGPANAGRYAAVGFALKSQAEQADKVRAQAMEPLAYIAECDAPVEVSLQLLQVRMRGAFLQALDEEIGNDKDVQELFGRSIGTMQAFNLRTHVMMKERQLEGFPYRVQRWEADTELPHQMLARQYKPLDLEPHELWIKDVFERCNEAHFHKLPKGPLEWYFPSRDPCPAEAAVVVLTGKHPELKKPCASSGLDRLSLWCSLPLAIRLSLLDQDPPPQGRRPSSFARRAWCRSMGSFRTVGASSASSSTRLTRRTPTIRCSRWRTTAARRGPSGRGTRQPTPIQIGGKAVSKSISRRITRRPWSSFVRPG